MQKTRLKVTAMFFKGPEGTDLIQLLNIHFRINNIIPKLFRTFAGKLNATIQYCNKFIITVTYIIQETQ